HILRMCDLLYAKPGYDCSPVATHSDGSIIGVDHPAKAGEEIVLYAFGLGNTMPTVPTGAAPTAPALVFLPFRASFDPRSNAAPSKPPASSPAQLFDGVTPGFVGLYQNQCAGAAVAARFSGVQPFARAHRLEPDGQRRRAGIVRRRGHLRSAGELRKDSDLRRATQCPKNFLRFLT